MKDVQGFFSKRYKAPVVEKILKKTFSVFICVPDATTKSVFENVLNNILGCDAEISSYQKEAPKEGEEHQ